MVKRNQRKPIETRGRKPIETRGRKSNGSSGQQPNVKRLKQLALTIQDTTSESPDPVSPKKTDLGHSETMSPFRETMKELKRTAERMIMVERLLHSSAGVIADLKKELEDERMKNARLEDKLQEYNTTIHEFASEYQRFAEVQLNKVVQRGTTWL